MKLNIGEVITYCSLLLLIAIIMALTVAFVGLAPHPSTPRPCACTREEFAPTAITVGEFVVLLPAASHCVEHERSTDEHPCVFEP
jgi:hypothetical protein